jgi:hypothetical protein
MRSVEVASGASAGGERRRRELAGSKERTTRFLASPGVGVSDIVARLLLVLECRMGWSEPCLPSAVVSTGSEACAGRARASPARAWGGRPAHRSPSARAGQPASEELSSSGTYLSHPAHH